MRTFLLLVLGSLLATCLPTSTPTPAATLTPGPAPTGQPTPGALTVEVLKATELSDLEWQEIPVVHVQDTSAVGLRVEVEGYVIWLHHPDDTTQDSYHFHVEGGGSGGGVYRGSGQSGDDFKVKMGWTVVSVKVTSMEVLKVGTVGGFNLYFRRIDGRWQVAVP